MPYQLGDAPLAAWMLVFVRLCAFPVFANRVIEARIASSKSLVVRTNSPAESIFVPAISLFGSNGGIVVKLKELSHVENVALLTIYRLCGRSGGWRSQLHGAVGESMTTNLLRHRLLQTKYVGGETMLFLSELGLAIAKSLDLSTRDVKENVTH